MMKMSPGCIAASEEFLRYYEPILRADLVALEAWRPGRMAPLPAPITVFLGESDMVTEQQGRQWLQQQRCHRVVMDGGVR